MVLMGKDIVSIFIITIFILFFASENTKAQIPLCGTGGRITVLSDTLCSGRKDTLHLTGQDGTIIGWQYRTDQTTEWQTVADTGLRWLTPPLTDKTYYRAVIRKGNCNVVYSATAVRWLDTQNAYLTGQSTACQNENHGVIKLEGTKQSVVRWESSVDQWQSKTVHLPTTTTLAYYNLTQTTAFRAVWQNCSQNEQTTTPVVISVERCERCVTPTNVRVIGISGQDVHLAWDYSGGYQLFQARYRRIGSNQWLTEARITGRSFRWRGLLTCEKYEFMIANVCGEDSLSAWSVPCTVNVLGSIQQARLEQIQDQSVMVKWSPVTGIPNAKYQVRFRMLGSGNWTETAGNITLTERRLIGLRPQTTYEVQIRAICPQGIIGNWTTDLLNFRTTGAVMNCNRPPIGIHLTIAPPTGRLKVSWQGIPSASGYEISYRAKNASPSESWQTRVICSPENSVFITEENIIPETVLVRLRSLCQNCGSESEKSPWSPVTEWKRP